MKVTDLGEIVKILKDLAQTVENLYLTNIGLAKLEGSRLGYLARTSDITKPAKPPEG